MRKIKAIKPCENKRFLTELLQIGEIPDNKAPFIKGDLVAQLVEHLTFNQGVAGSNPAEVTNINNLLIITRGFDRALFMAP